MNVIEQVTARIERYRKTNKQPCKNYASQAAAERATEKAAAKAGRVFDTNGTPARYVVFRVDSWNRWVGALDYTEMMARRTYAGGYLGAVAGFYVY